MSAYYDTMADCEKETPAASAAQSIYFKMNTFRCDPCMKKWFENCNSLHVLVVGRSGNGKSSFINAMFSMEDAEVADGREQTTMFVNEYKREVDGVKLSLFDSPGLQDGHHEDKHYTKKTKETCKAVSLMMYCVRMDDQLRQNDKDTIKTIAEALGNDIWKHADKSHILQKPLTQPLPPFLLFKEVGGAGS